MAKVLIEKFENFNKFEREIQRYFKFKKLIHLNKYLIQKMKL